MPLWRIFHPSNTFTTAEERDALSADITSIYTNVDEKLKPHIADKGYDWEYHGHETDRELWKIQGMVPPDRDTEGERLWVKENKAVPF
ncbi:putative 4-oxalocrotonate tautomerase protein [Neofusicoccum parvum UCRNP2]|uniref:Putative 4-oxalocrotonate tautomerase protein n=1 Tax=Botryosphaeria parva (strain UCR-NP2) TaxID=1287680 RepID=R1EV09_BOTPV|nr:putative 4-oxalocrotonate tautomerase protein [Neofusicoccum parvum UCRNP2]